MSSSPIASFTAPFTLTTTQNESVLTPFDLWCTPSPPRCREPHKFQIFPVVVNSATAGVHYRSTGSGDPLVPLSLFHEEPWCIANLLGPSSFTGDDQSRPAACHRLPRGLGHYGQLPSDLLHPTSFDSQVQQVMEELFSPLDEHPAASSAAHRR
jgi:hypothetical protein